MLKKLFGGKSKERKTGVYKIANQSLEELNDLPGGGSINEIIIELGYNTEQIHTVLTFNSKQISSIGVKIFTKEPVFVLTNVGVANLKMSTLNSELRNINWDSEYSSSGIESILTEGIENKSLTIEYLKSVIQLNSKTETIFLAKELDLYLHFEVNILIDFSSTDGLNAASKWLKSINEPIFNNMLAEATTYHVSEMDAIEEVNIQCGALRSIPEAINNEFIDEHVNSFGNYNFYNLLAAHYNPELSKDNFIHVNKERFIKLSENEFKVDRFVYQFSEIGLLENAWKE